MDERGTCANVHLLTDVALYLTYLLKVFGVIAKDIRIGFPIQDEGLKGDIVSLSIIIVCIYIVASYQEEVVMPYASALADFRERVRDVALEEKGMFVF